MRILRLLTIILLTLLTFTLAVAEDIQSEFLLSDPATKIKQGDIIEGTLRFWPVENADLNQFRKIEKTVLFDSLYLTQTLNLGLSQNNADVVELKGLFIVKSAKVLPTQNFKYNNTSIDIKSGNLSVEELSDKNKEFYIADQSLSSSKLWLVVVGTILIIIILAIYKKDSIKNYFLNRRTNSIKKNRKKYDELFKKADLREEFEFIYKEKNNWIKLLNETTPAHLDFLKVLNQHQFKKSWGNEEYTDVRAAFDVIRRSFEK